jgi:hypothetical protein
MTDQNIGNVISVCTIKDIQTWAHTAKYILKNIKATNYHLIVPQRYLAAFREITPQQIRLHSENSVSNEFNYDSLKQFFPTSNENRVGWYYQQLLKIQGLLLFGEHEDQINLVWDADTIPIRQIEFTQAGKIIFFKGKEYHTPYFETIYKLLALKKITEFSFIAQCFPVKHRWIIEFKNYLQSFHSKTWFEAIIDSADLSNPASFSEYETLGTYFAHKYSSEMLINNSYWERFGNKLVELENLENYISSDTNKPAYLSFESWDPHKKNIM